MAVERRIPSDFLQYRIRPYPRLGGAQHPVQVNQPINTQRAGYPRASANQHSLNVQRFPGSIRVLRPHPHPFREFKNNLQDGDGRAT